MVIKIAAKDSTKLCRLRGLSYVHVHSDIRKILELRQILDRRQSLYPLKKFIDQRWNFINIHGSLEPHNFLTHATHVPTHLRTHPPQIKQEPTQPTQYSRIMQQVKL